MSKNHKWKMNRAGLLNFWYYDDEIFDFADGKLLLRGSNGSGKSVTMQSILPVLLDGKKSPDRLDPFGSRARKMEDYLLGEKDVVDRDERTGYLFLEYKREDTNQFITTGIGLQARRHKNMNFWGFVITDNRRIGQDFTLYELENNGGEKQRIPLSRVQLENRIGSGGQVVRTQGEYMKLVNKHIFGFADMDAYDDLIKLLIQLRSPKLSKEFRPTAIYEILEASLPPLTDDDLRHLSDTIEHMDQTKQQIEQLEREATALEKLLKRYDTYNQYKLADKANQYVEAKKRYNKEEKTFSEKQNQKQKLEASIAEFEERKRELDQTSAVLEQKRNRLQSHKVWNLETEKQNEEKGLRELKADHDKRDKALTEKKQQELRTKERQEQLEADLDDMGRELGDMIDDLDQDAEDASFLQHSLNKDDFERHQDTDHDFSVWKKEAEQHYQALESITDQLREYEQKKTAIADLDGDMASAKMDQDKLKQEEQDWLGIFEKDKQDKLSEIHTWAERYDFLPISDEVLQQTSRDMYRLYEPVKYENIRTAFVQAGTDYELEINKQIARKDSRITRIEEDIRSKQLDLDELKKKRDPEPPNQQEQTRDARRKLAESGYHFVPFYEAVEFQEDTPEDVRQNIEAALIDAGLLDALITDEAFPIEHDRILEATPNMMAHTLADYLQPDLDDKATVSEVRVDEVLRSILVDDDTADSVVINGDGTYQIGLMRGHAVRVEQVRFIGRNARKRYRQQQIEQLTAEIEALETEKQTVEQDIDALRVNIQEAKDAIAAFPVDEDLAESFSHIKEKRFDISQYEKKLHEMDEQMSQLNQAYREIKSKLDVETRDFNLEFSYEAYQQAQRIMRQYEKDLHSLINKHTTYRYTAQQLQQTQERLDELVSEVDELQGELNVLADRQSQKEQNIAEIEKQLESAGVADIRRQIQEVQEDISATTHELDQIKTDLPKKVADRDVLVGEMQTAEQKLGFWKNMIGAWQEAFNDEVTLGFVDVPDQEMDALAAAIAKQYKDFLKEKDPSTIESQLTSAYFEQQSNLMEYRMTDTEMPATELDWMRDDWNEEQRIQMDNWRQKTSRRLIELDFQGKRVSPYYIKEKVETDRAQQQSMLDDQDRQLYEEILFDSVGKKLRSRINRAQDWTEKMNKLMTNSDSSSGLSFSIKWKPRTAETEAEMDTKELVDLLRRDARLLKEEDINQVIEHFRSKIERAKELVEVKGEGNTLLQVLKDVLDYRNWFSFVLSYQREGEPKRELTNHAFYKFSGGEKAMAMYIPLFTACYSRYLEADKTAPYIISLDEAFAGVDENNIREMFEIVEELEFDYIMNSQVLWGDYDTISSLAIAELVRPKNESFVSVIRYHWDGNTRHLVVSGEDEVAATDS
ncbi:TIGR02680 family protein [Lentibacillus salicampi]|uniref:TIGR02680 family protein n=1 Tax=Lentibacillus salicampi TaxID=175306 RepID=A0A4Y9AEG5_9BACI|nr:TIGR02680 family protein [Lentibacillus salicampi]TFJ94288.1 TIGR02680 family protein [Lentibacillus salicampi]